jgi:hypothetical protein
LNAGLLLSLVIIGVRTKLGWMILIVVIGESVREVSRIVRVWSPKKGPEN